MCGLCEKSQAFLHLENVKGICIPCLIEVKKFSVSAPNPYQTGE